MPANDSATSSIALTASRKKPQAEAFITRFASTQAGCPIRAKGLELADALA
jgi:hypothetical protein